MVLFVIFLFVFDSYKDYRSTEDYSHTQQFWIILAARFAFVIVFEVSLLFINHYLLFLKIRLNS